MAIISDQELDQLLAASPAERVTKEYMESRIANTEFNRIGLTTTHCSIVLDNGFSVSGESACVNVENYNQQIGEKIAYDNAYRQLWALFGFLLAEKNKLQKSQAASTDEAKTEASTTTEAAAGESTGAAETVGETSTNTEA